MGRPPCCDKVDIKKGPWTPEEDIILVSYIQEHGPGNWRSVPTKTGLMRCSKSCRLRWTNYLRPGIKRGNFTPHEEGMIIHLQALLGNKWAAIASYLPQRTDNDIKNYWNTHLKKKMKKCQATLDPHLLASSSHHSPTTSHLVSNSLNDKRSSNLDIISSSFRLSQSHQSSSSYASSTQNISKLLEGWMRSSPKPETSILSGSHDNKLQINNGSFENTTSVPAFGSCHEETKEGQEIGDMVIPHEEFDSILSFDENMNSATCWDKSTCDSVPEKMSYEAEESDDVVVMAERNCTQRSDRENSNHPPLSLLENWLLDENVGQVEEMMHLSSMF